MMRTHISPHTAAIEVLLGYLEKLDGPLRSAGPKTVIRHACADARIAITRHGGDATASALLHDVLADAESHQYTDAAQPLSYLIEQLEKANSPVAP